MRGNFLMFFLGMELASIPMACLIAFDKYRHNSAEAGAKYILCALFSSGLMLYGISFIYGTAGTFNTNIGHDYFGSSYERFMSYKNKAKKVPFSIKILNMITKGGAEFGTLNLILAGVNVGKSLGLCSLAADYLKDGHDVLYVSMEMAEEVVGKRIDAALLDISMDDIDEGLITESEFVRKIEARRNKGCGRLIIKQFPTGGANVNHLHNLMSELELKKGFKPTVVIVDYLGIMSSSRMKYSENSYTMVKAISEELRGFAIEHNVVCWSAAQTNRSGWDNLDVQMGDIAESAGLAATADFILAVMESDELAEINQQKFKQIKSRYGDKSKMSSFLLTVLKNKQRWMDIDVNGGGTAEESVQRQQEQFKDIKSTRGKMAVLAESAEVGSALSWDE
jgi:KaiC/GvpD/RAD55 family RecA-like ATPase